VERARLYSNENFPRRVVEALRKFGHDVLTSFDAGRANQRVPDHEVLDFATSEYRAVLTLNRRDFIKLHRSTKGKHGGIIVCSSDQRVDDFAGRIDQAIREADSVAGLLIRVNRPSE
jgi:predicted nuclease of predicted toxin-antitoxin system